MRYLRCTAFFMCSPYDYTLEWYTSIQAKIHDFITYAFCRYVAFVCFGVHMYCFCLYTVDTTIDRSKIEKYSQYDKSCKTAQLNCIQPSYVCNIWTNIHISICLSMRFSNTWHMNTWAYIHMFFKWTYVHMSTCSYNQCMNIWAYIHLKNPLHEIRLHTIQLYDRNLQKPYWKFLISTNNDNICQ